VASQPTQQKMGVKKQHHRVAKTSKQHHRIAKASSKRHLAKAGKRHHIAKARSHRLMAKPRQATTTLQQSTMQPRKLQARRPVRETTGSGAVSMPQNQQPKAMTPATTTKKKKNKAATQ
jgi:hypothetical protein